MLHQQALSPDTLGLLRQLQARPELTGLRLVGGTSLALQIGHRQSVDLDLFGRLACAPDALPHSLQALGQVTILSTAQNIHVYRLNGVKVDVVNYPYAWLEPPITTGGVVLAGKQDIAAMKLASITNRGAKKDFVDLYFLLREFTLRQLLDAYTRKFPEASEFLVLRSLAYFDDADEDPDPLMLAPWSWPQTKAAIQDALRAVAL